MAENHAELLGKTEPAGLLNTAINILTSPAEAFTEIRQRPTTLVPLLITLGASALVLFWYFSILDFDWFIDDTLSAGAADENEREAAREVMQSVPHSTFMIFGILSSSLSLLVIYVLQAGYLSLAAALGGHQYKFGHWFSLVIWCGLPYLFSVLGMAVTILLSVNGQLGAYDLDPLSLANLGVQSDNSSIQQIMSSLNLTMIWSLAWVVMAHMQWVGSNVFKAMAIVLAPYLLIFGTMAYFALS